MTASIVLPGRKETTKQNGFYTALFKQQCKSSTTCTPTITQSAAASPAGVLGFLLKADIGLVRLSRFGEGFDLFISIPLWTCYARQAGQAIEDAKSLWVWGLSHTGSNLYTALSGSHSMLLVKLKTCGTEPSGLVRISEAKVNIVGNMYNLKIIGQGIKETYQDGAKDSLDATQYLRNTIPRELYE